MPTPTEQLCTGCEYFSAGPLADGFYCKAPEGGSICNGQQRPQAALERLGNDLLWGSAGQPGGAIVTRDRLEEALRRAYQLGYERGKEQSE